MSSFVTSTNVMGDGQLLTPDAVIIDLPFARVGSRASARLIDEIVINILWLMAIWLIVIGALALKIPGGAPFVILLFFLLFLRIGAVAAINFYTNGRSPGKMIYGLRIVSRDGSPATFRQFFIREILAIFEISTFSFLAVITSFVSKTGRRIGDFAADTIVIHQRGNTAGEQTGFVWQTPPELDSYVSSLDVGRLDEKSYAIIRQYLIRCQTFTKTSRGNVALTLAQRMSQRSGIPMPPQLHPELFLLAIAAKTQRQDGLAQYQGQVENTPAGRKQAATQANWAGVHQANAPKPPVSGFGPEPATASPSWDAGSVAATPFDGSGSSSMNGAFAPASNPAAMPAATQGSITSAFDGNGFTSSTVEQTPVTPNPLENTANNFAATPQQNAPHNPLSTSGFSATTNAPMQAPNPAAPTDAPPLDFKDPFA